MSSEFIRVGDPSSEWQLNWGEGGWIELHIHGARSASIEGMMV